MVVERSSGKNEDLHLDIECPREEDSGGRSFE
jgi:hypothetical protein